MPCCYHSKRKGGRGVMIKKKVKVVVVSSECFGMVLQV